MWHNPQTILRRKRVRFDHLVPHSSKISRSVLRSAHLRPETALPFEATEIAWPGRRILRNVADTLLRVREFDTCRNLSLVYGQSYTAAHTELGCDHTAERFPDKHTGHSFPLQYNGRGMDMELALSRLRGLRSAPCVLAIAGLALYWPMFRRPFLGSIFTHAAPELYGALFFFQVIAIVVGFMLAMAPEMFAKLSERSTITPTICSILMFASALYIQTAGDHCVAGLLALSTLLLAVGFAGIGLQCATVCQYLGPDAPSALMISFLVSFLIGTVELAPEGVRWASTLLPLFCVMCLLLAQRGFHIEGTTNSSTDTNSTNSTYSNSASSANPATTDAATTHETNSFQDRWTRVLGPYGIALMVVTMLAGVFTRSSWLFHAVGYNPSLRGLMTYLCSVALAVIMLVIFRRAKSIRAAFLSCLALLLCAVLAGVIACAITEGQIGGRLVTSAYTCVQFCLWTFLVLRSVSRVELTSSVGFFLCIDQTCCLLMNYCIPGILGINTESASGLMMPLGLAGTSAISVAAIAIVAGAFVRLSATNRFVQPASTMPQDGVEDSTHADVGRFDPASVAARFDLTHREAEVAICLAQGNSVKRTAEKLYIAPSTVQSFSKSIYRKMGIHSKQALIDAFEESD